MLPCAFSYMVPKDPQRESYSQGLWQMFGAKICGDACSPEAMGGHGFGGCYCTSLNCSLLRHFSHFRPVFYC